MHSRNATTPDCVLSDESTALNRYNKPFTRTQLLILCMELEAWFCSCTVYGHSNAVTYYHYTVVVANNSLCLLRRMVLVVVKQKEGLLVIPE